MARKRVTRVRRATPTKRKTVSTTRRKAVTSPRRAAVSPVRRTATNIRRTRPVARGRNVIAGVPAARGRAPAALPPLVSGPIIGRPRGFRAIEQGAIPRTRALAPVSLGTRVTTPRRARVAGATRPTRGLRTVPTGRIRGAGTTRPTRRTRRLG